VPKIRQESDIFIKLARCPLAVTFTLILPNFLAIFGISICLGMLFGASNLKP
jgi:hypothetical protein